MNQRKTTKSSIKSLPKRALPLVALPVLAVGSYLVFANHSNNQSANKPSNTADAKAEAQAKKQFIETGDKADQSSDTDTSPTNSSKITDLTAKQEDNSTVTVFTKLSNDTSGQCLLKVSNGAKSVSKSADIIYQPEFSTCEGFSLPISSLGYGNWTINLSAAGSNKTITIEVIR
ncbi:hypothetical protein KW794_03645 [Candidatus Saccharibacteria bacterium]|nr:hypothetical protein [Candidatus Saccharibacteria bacterium]